MIRVWDRQREPGRVWMTTALVAINILSYWVTRGEDFARFGGIIPAEWFHPEVLGLAAGDRPPALVTVFWSMFLHANAFHVLGNMAFLALFGPNLEARLGQLRFGLFYFSCGAAGCLTHVAFDPQSLIPVIGASGAIAGILGGYWVWYADHEFHVRLGTIRSGKREFVVPVKILLVIWLLLQILNGVFPDPQETVRVAYLTHLGGFACGYVLAKGPQWMRQRRFKVFQGGSHKASWND